MTVGTALPLVNSVGAGRLLVLLTGQLLARVEGNRARPQLDLDHIYMQASKSRKAAETDAG